MVYFMGNPNLKWMMTGATPMTQEQGCRIYRAKMGFLAPKTGVFSTKFSRETYGSYQHWESTRTRQMD